MTPNSRLDAKDAYGAYGIDITSPDTFDCFEAPITSDKHRRLLHLLLASHTNMTTVCEELSEDNENLILLGKIEMLEQLLDVVAIEFQHTYSH